MSLTHRLLVVRRFLSIAILALAAWALPLSAPGQGQPPSLWMRGGNLLGSDGGTFADTVPVWSTDGRFIAVPKVYSVDILRASDGMLLKSITEPVARTATAQFYATGLAIFDEDPNGTGDARNRIRFFDAVSGWQLAQTLEVAPALHNGDFYVSADGTYAILEGNLYTINYPSLTLSPLTLSYAVPPAAYTDGEGYFMGFAPPNALSDANITSPQVTLGDAAYGYFDNPGVPGSNGNEIVSCVTGATLWDFPYNDAGLYQPGPGAGNQFSPDMSIYNLTNGAGTSVYSTISPFNLLDDYGEVPPYCFDLQTAWPLTNSGLYAMSGSDDSFGVYSENGLSNVWLQNTGNAEAMVFSPDGANLATWPIGGGSIFGYGQILAGTTGALVTRLSWANNGVGYVHSPDGSLVAVGSWTTPPPAGGGNNNLLLDQGLQIWNTVTGALVSNILAGPGVETLAMADDNTVVVGYSNSNSYGSWVTPSYNIAAYSISTGEQLWSETLDSPGVNISSVQVKNGVGFAYSANGRYYNFYTFNPWTGGSVGNVNLGRNGASNYVLSPDGTMVLNKLGGSIWVSDTLGNQIGNGINSAVGTYGIAWSPSGAQVVCVGVGGTASACIYNVSSAGLSGPPMLIGTSTQETYDVAWSGDGTAIAVQQFAANPASGNLEYQIAIINPVTGAQVAMYDDQIDGSLPNGYPEGVLDGDATGQTFCFTGQSGMAASFLNPLHNAPATSISLNPPSQVGGQAVVATVTLAQAAPAGGALVLLSSQNPAAAVPPTMTVAAGSTSGTFTITTSSVTATTIGLITATSGGATVSSSLTVAPPATTGDSISSLSLNPEPVIGGQTSTGTITLASPAPAGGWIVSLTSSSAYVTVPASVTIPSGSTTGTFSLTTTAKDYSYDSQIHSSDPASHRYATLNVSGDGIASLVLNPNPVTGGQTSTGTVTLSSPAPAGGWVVNLTSSSSYVTVPSSITVAAGSTTGTFSLTTTAKDYSYDSQIHSSDLLTHQYATLDVGGDGIASLVLNPNPVTGGQASTGTVTLSSPAPAGGWVVNLTSSNPKVVVPSSITIAAGSTTGTFTLTTVAETINYDSQIHSSDLLTHQYATLNVTAP